jgi:hypothetical protein
MTVGLKVVFGDPGRLGDPFGIMGASFSLGDYKIRWKLAKQFIKRPYSDVAMYLIGIKETIRPNFMGIETNNRGKRLLQLFHQKYGMNYIHGINTSANLTEKTRNMGYSMDKPYMVGWFKEAKQKGMMLFPKDKDASKDMKEFMTQIPQIVPLPTMNGSTTYKAQRGRHDDLFMAGLHVCNIIRLFILEQERLK